MNHEPEFQNALERSRSRRQDTEHQLRHLRGRAQDAALAELDALLAHEVLLEARLTEVLHRSRTSVMS